ncbi:MAG: TetR family transcriptional regulator [Myxococcota bacterium]
MARYARASSPDQKEQRRDAITAAARRLFETRRYDEVTMAAIGKAAKVAKGTVFFYFGTKEALFLAVARQEIEQFFADFQAGLAKRRAPAGPRGVVRILGEAFERPTLVRLLGLLHVVLENNVSFETALAFRRALVPLLEQTGAQWERHLPFLAPGHGARLLLQVHAMALGFGQLSDPGPTLRRVQEQPDMELFDIDFRSALLGSVELMLLGMQARAEPKRSRSKRPARSSA